ncbi:unnamed protein product [Discosporangium mesarthrocarpum]
MSIRQERRLLKLASSLPGTMVFFDKFCPELCLAANNEGSTFILPPAPTGPTGQNAEATGMGAPSATGPEPAALVRACHWSADYLRQHRVRAVRQGGQSGCVQTHEGEDILSPVVILSDNPVFSSLVQETPVGGGSGRMGEVLHLDCEAFVDLFCRAEARRLVHAKRVILGQAFSSMTGFLQEGPGQQVGTVLDRSQGWTPHPTKEHLEARLQTGELLKGRLDVFEHNPGEGVVVASAMGGREGLEGWASLLGKVKVLVSGRSAMNRAIHGDVVAIQLLPKKMWQAPTGSKRLTYAPLEEKVGDQVDEVDQLDGDMKQGKGVGNQQSPPSGAMPTGRVVGVLEHGWRPYVATIPLEEGLGLVNGGEEWAMAVPMDSRIPKIRIRTRQLAQISGKRLVVSLDDWEEHSFHPTGHYVSTLGPVGEVASEAGALLVECGARFDPFSFSALASLPRVRKPPKAVDSGGYQSATAAITSAVSSMSDKLGDMPMAAQRERPLEGYGCSPQWEDSGWQLCAEDLEGRRDLRGVRVVSVDPPGCQDIDDAMHVRALGNGRLEVGVHIADVTHFVSPDGPLDREARARATTVYLVHRRIDMLPSLLSGDICSLHQGKDRLAVSVIWEVEEVEEQARRGDGGDLSDPSQGSSAWLERGLRVATRENGSQVCWFGRTVIHSSASMTYQQAQSLVEEGRVVYPLGESHRFPPPGQAGGDIATKLQPALAQDLRLLTRLARSLRKQRMGNGAVELSQSGVELKFKLNPETGTPEAVKGKEELEIHHTVAELMILANASVASKIKEAFPSSALLRTHAPPQEHNMDDVHKLASKVGMVPTSGNEGQGLGETLRLGAPTTKDHAHDHAKLKTKAEKLTADLIKSITTRAMSEAEYVCTGSLNPSQRHGGGPGKGDSERFSHFGLGLDLYTHFTSPIRRYADVVVHRLLLAALRKLSKAPQEEYTPDPTGSSYSVPPGGAKSAPRGVMTTTEDNLPSSMAPSVLEMEEEAVEREEMLAQGRKAHRARAGDASATLNPDGTTTFKKARNPPTITNCIWLIALCRLERVRSAQKVKTMHYPEMGFVGFGSLGFDTQGNTRASVLQKDFGSEAELDITIELLCLKSLPQSAAVSQTCFVPSSEAGGVGKAMTKEIGHTGDVLDGLDTGGATIQRDRVREERDGEGDHRGAGVKMEGGGDRSGEKGRGEGKAPFDGPDLEKLCSHLNNQNRSAKHLSMRCQELFLRLYFKDHYEVVDGIVLGLRSNGFMAYVPEYGTKGPVYLCDQDGNVQMDPTLLGLQATAGLPPTKGFAALRTCRLLPGARVSQTNGAGKRAGGGGERRGEGSDDDVHVLEVTAPTGSGGTVLRIRELDIHPCTPPPNPQMSCEVFPSQARLPKVRFILTGLGQSRRSQQQQASIRGKEHNNNRNLSPTAGVTSASSAAPPRPSSDSDEAKTCDENLYMLLQDSLQEALKAAPTQRIPGAESMQPSPAPTASIRNNQVIKKDLEVVSTNGAELPPSDGKASTGRTTGKKKNRWHKSKHMGSGCSTEAVACAERKEVGTGRLLYGGFVPPRDAPAVSLFDFGEERGGVLGQGGAIQGGGQGHGYEGIREKLVSPNRLGGTLASLDEARVREYTQQAMYRSQRLGAEKRNARVAKAKSRN